MIQALAAVAVVAATTAAPCREHITPALAQALFDALRGRTAPCEFEGISTSSSRAEVRLKALPPVVVEPAGCAQSPTHAAAVLAATVPPDVQRECPAAVAALTNALALAPSAQARAADAPPREWPPLFFAGVLVFAFVAGLLVRQAVRSWKQGCDAREAALFAGLFALALGVRAAVQPAPSNWYTDVLPPTGPPEWMRFGPGAFVLQSALRLVLPWSDTTLVAANTLLGTLAPVLLAALLRERGVDRIGSAAAGVLLALAPLHAGISRSASEHVLASTLQLGALLAFARAVRTGSRSALVLALALVPAAGLTRPDALPLLALVPLWGLLRDGHEQWRDEEWRRRAVPLAAYAAVFAASAVVVWRLVALPSNHPLPDARGLVYAAQHVLSQFATLAFREPRWYAPVALLVGIAGCCAMLLRRPVLLLLVGATALVPFVALGRTLPRDELVGARYFLVPLALTFVPAGWLAGATWSAASKRLRLKPAASAATASVVLGLLALAAWSPSRTAYSHRYTFQDEYLFLRRQLTALPDGCTVWQLPMRPDGIDRDLDCCLDLEASPLTAAFPKLRLRTLTGDAAPAASECAWWYEGAACDMTPDEEAQREHGPALEYFRRRCAQLRSALALERGPATPVSTRTTWGLFRTPARVTLHRLPPARPPGAQPAAADPARPDATNAAAR